MSETTIITPQQLRNRAKEVNNQMLKYWLRRRKDTDETKLERLRSNINQKNISKIIDDKTYDQVIKEILNKYRTYFKKEPIEDVEEINQYLNKVFNKNRKHEQQTPGKPEEEQIPKDAEQSEITKTIRKEPLRNKGDKFNKIVSDETLEAEEQPTEEDTTEEEPTEEEPKEENTTEEQQPTDKSIIPLPETKLSTNEIAETYNKIIDDFYNDTNAEQFLKRIKYISMLVPEEKFAEIAETEAIKLAQMNINGVKPFKDVAEARQFIYDIRYGNNKRFKGQNQHVYKLPKLQKMIKQEQQKNNIISPMFLRNIKPLSQTKHIYEY